MTPDDLAVVERSWTELRARRPQLLEHLAGALPAGAEPDTPLARARRLFDATNELVGLLDTPSRLATHARAVAATWDVGAATPRYDVDGDAWMRAAGEVCPSWSIDDELAWRRAWLLLADVLAEESLAPFGKPLSVTSRGPQRLRPPTQ